MSKGLKANISWLAVIKIVNVLLPLITLPHLTHTLGTTLFGVVAIGFAIQQVVFSICDYGFGILAPKLVVESNKCKSTSGELLTSILAIKFFIFLILASITYLILQVSPAESSYKLIWSLMLIPAAIQSFIPIWLFLGFESMQKVTYVTLIERALYTVCIFLFIDSPKDVQNIAYIMILSMGLAFFTSQILIKRLGISLRKTNIKHIKSLVIQGWEYFYSRITMLLFSKFNVIIVGSVLGESSAGIYSLAERIYNAGRSLCSPLTDALYPYMVRTKNWTLAFKIVRYAALFAILGSITSWLFSDWFFVTLFGSDDFIASAELFNLLMFAFSFSLISMIIGFPILGAMGKSKHVNRSVVYGALIHIVFIGCTWLLGLLTNEVLVVSLILTELFILLYRAIALHKSYSSLNSITTVTATQGVEK